MNEKRTQAFSNFAWKLAEQVGSQMVSLVVSIILARLLMPNDYSVVGIIIILTSFCAVFTDGGLAKALIQKKDADDLDYSTVLTVGFFMSLVLYVALFFSAPFVADIYNNPILVPIIRVYSLKLFIGAFTTVQSAYISKNLLFKKYFFATLTGTVISACVGIYGAYIGWGPWALVAQKMINLIVDTLILLYTAKFRPKRGFSLKRLKTLWKYGSKVLGTSLADMLYDNARPLIVGLKFSNENLAYYQKGQSYPGIINSTLSSTLSAVLFPVMAKEQDDHANVKNITKKFISVTSFLIFPALLGLAAVSNTFIIVLLTEKWKDAIPYMQIFCVNFMFLLLQTGNLQAINAIGRSDVVFKLAILKKSISFVLLFLLIIVANNPLYLAALGILTSLIAYIINSFTNKKLLNYGLKEQFKDISLNLVCALIMAGAIYSLGKLPYSPVILLVAQIPAGVLLYYLLAKLTKNPNLGYCTDTLKAFVRKKK